MDSQASLETVQRDLRALLLLQAPRPSSAICNIIANLKDLCEVGGNLDWRRGGPASSSRFPTSASSESLNRRMGFRTDTRDGAGSPLSRNSSRQSFQAGGSPVANASPPPPIAKYQSQFKNSAQPVDERILYNIILSKLNKFSPKTYDEIREFLYQVLGSGEPDLQEMIRDFMRLVFRKAAVEEVFCPLYAKLLCEISSRYTVILQEMQALQANYLSIFDEVTEDAGSNYATFVEGHQARQYRRGYSQFLAELTGLEILSVDLLNTTFQRILTNMQASAEDEGKRTLLEEYADCLFRMAKVLRKKSAPFFVAARQGLLRTNQAALEALLAAAASSAAPGISAKAKFVLMDVKDILQGL